MEDYSLPDEGVGSDPTDSPKANPNAIDDPLQAIDEIESEWLAKKEEELEHARAVLAERRAFADDFAQACADRVRPAMEAVIDRLRRDGGDGVITERSEDPSRLFTHRLTLWMSLEGKIEGTPRQDRHPYLQFDAHPETKVVTMSEGDMWQGHGGNHSGRVGECQISELDARLVDHEIVAILHRSAGEVAG